MITIQLPLPPNQGNLSLSTSKEPVKKYPWKKHSSIEPNLDKVIQVPIIPQKRQNYAAKKQLMKMGPMKSLRKRFNNSNQGWQRNGVIAELTGASRMTPMEQKDTLRDESIVSSKQETHRPTKMGLDSQRANIVIIKDQKIPKELLVGIKLPAQTNNQTSLAGSRVPFKSVPLTDFFSISQRNNHNDSSGLSQKAEDGNGDTIGVEVIGGSLDTSMQAPMGKRSVFQGTATSTLRNDKADHVPNNLQSFAVQLKMTKKQENVSENLGETLHNNQHGTGGETFVGESILSPDQSKDPHQFTSTNQTDRAISLQSENPQVIKLNEQRVNSNQQKQQNSNSKIEPGQKMMPTHPTELPNPHKIIGTVNPNLLPISHSDRLQSFGVKTSNFSQFRSNWLDEENIKHATEILSRLEIQADRMSHGYYRHGFERGRKTHFRARKGKLFDTEEEDASQEDRISLKREEGNRTQLSRKYHEGYKTSLGGGSMGKPLTQMQSMRSKVFFGKRNQGKQVVVRTTGQQSIGKSINTSQENLKKSINKDTTVDSVDDKRSSLRSRGEQPLVYRQAHSNHFDMTQIPLSRKALFDKYNELMTVRMMRQAVNNSKNQSRQFLTVKMDHGLIKNTAKLHGTHDMTSGVNTSNYPSTIAATQLPNNYQTAAVGGHIHMQNQKMSPRLTGNPQLSPIRSNNISVIADSQNFGTGTSVILNPQQIPDPDQLSKNMGSRQTNSNNFMDYPEKLHTFSVVDAVASDVASDLSPNNTGRRNQPNGIINGTQSDDVNVTQIRCGQQDKKQSKGVSVGCADVKFDQQRRSKDVGNQVKINVSMGVKEKDEEDLDKIKDTQQRCDEKTPLLSITVEDQAFQSMENELDYPNLPLYVKGNKRNQPPFMKQYTNITQKTIKQGKSSMSDNYYNKQETNDIQSKTMMTVMNTGQSRMLLKQRRGITPKSQSSLAQYPKTQSKHQQINQLRGNSQEKMKKYKQTTSLVTPTKDSIEAEINPQNVSKVISNASADYSIEKQAMNKKLQDNMDETKQLWVQGKVVELKSARVESVDSGQKELQMARVGNSSPPLEISHSPTNIASRKQKVLMSVSGQENKVNQERNQNSRRDYLTIKSQQTSLASPLMTAAAFEIAQGQNQNGNEDSYKQAPKKLPKEIDQILKNVQEQVYLNKKFLPKFDTLKNEKKSKKVNQLLSGDTFFNQNDQGKRFRSIGVTDYIEKPSSRHHSNNKNVAKMPLDLIDVQGSSEKIGEGVPFGGRNDPSIVSLKDPRIQSSLIKHQNIKTTVVVNKRSAESSKRPQRFQEPIIGVSAPSSSTKDRHNVSSQEGFLTSLPEIPQYSSFQEKNSSSSKNSPKKTSLKKVKVQQKQQRNKQCSRPKPEKKDEKDKNQAPTIINDTDGTILFSPRSPDRTKLALKKGQSLYNNGLLNQNRQMHNEKQELQIRKITSSPQVMINNRLGLRKEQSSEQKKTLHVRPNVLATAQYDLNDVIDEQVIMCTDRDVLVRPPNISDPDQMQRLVTKLLKQELRKQINSILKQKQLKKDNQISDYPTFAKRKAQNLPITSDLTPAVCDANDESLLMEYQLRISQQQNEKNSVMPSRQIKEVLSQNCDDADSEAAEDVDDGEELEAIKKKIAETAMFMRRLNSRLTQHVLVEGGCQVTGGEIGSVHSSQDNVRPRIMADDRFVEVTIGVEKEIEVFPQKASEVGVDEPDNLPVIIRIQGLEEGKKYQLTVRSVLIRPQKPQQVISSTASPLSVQSKRFSLNTPIPNFATNNTGPDAKSRFGIKSMMKSPTGSPDRRRDTASVVNQFQEALPVQDIKLYMSSRVLVPNANTHNDYQLFVENLNEQNSTHELRINIKERPSWMKDELFQDDTLYGSLFSHTGCFVKILIRDTEVKKDKKKEPAAAQQPKQTDLQIYEQKLKFEKEVQFIVGELREYFRDNVIMQPISYEDPLQKQQSIFNTNDYIRANRTFIQKNIYQVHQFSKEERMKHFKERGAKYDSELDKVRDRATRIEEERRQGWLRWMQRWDQFRNLLETEKEVLCRKIKQVVVVRRLLAVQKITVFVKKLKQIQQYIRVKARRQQASLFISIKAYIRLRRQLLQMGPSFNQRMRRYHVMNKMNFYAIMKHESNKLEAKSVIKEFLFKNGLLTTAISAQFNYLDKVIQMQRFYRAQKQAREYIFRFHRQQIDKQRGQLYDYFKKKNDQTPIAKKILKKSHMIASPLLDDMVKIFLDYKQSLFQLKNLQYMQALNEVLLIFLNFLKENTECVNRTKTGLAGVTQKVIDDFINKRIDHATKELSRLASNFLVHKEKIEQNKKDIFAPAKDAQVTYKIYQKQIQGVWKKYKKKKNVMVMTYAQMREQAVEGEKKMFEKKVYMQMAVTGETKQQVIERLKAQKKTCCPDLPQYEPSNDMLPPKGLLSEHKLTCAQCHFLKQQYLQEQQLLMQPVTPSKDKKGKKGGKSPEKTNNLSPAVTPGFLDPKDMLLNKSQLKKLEEIVCEECLKAYKAQVDQLLEEVANQYTGSNFMQLFRHYHLERLIPESHNSKQSENFLSEGKYASDPGWPNILRTQMVDLHKIILKACSYDVGYRLLDGE